MTEYPQKDEALRQQEQEKKLLRERVLRVVMTSEARQRLANVKMVKPDVAALIEDQIIQLASAGKVKRPITDEEVRQFLAALQQPKRDFKIRWI